MPMFRRLGRAATIAAATSVVLLGSAGAASAQSLTLHDARHDVWSGSSVDDPATFRPAPSQKGGDVWWARVAYGKRSVVLTEKYADLARRGSGDLYALRLRTNRGLRRIVEVQAFPHGWAGSLAMYIPGGRSVTCDGAAEHLDYAGNVLRISVPADCLHNPRWVQFTAASGHITRDNVWLVDNPHNTKASYDGWSRRVRKG